MRVSFATLVLCLALAVSTSGFAEPPPDGVSEPGGDPTLEEEQPQGPPPAVVRTSRVALGTIAGTGTALGFAAAGFGIDVATHPPQSDTYTLTGAIIGSISGLLFGPMLGAYGVGEAMNGSGDIGAVVIGQGIGLGAGLIGAVALASSTRTSSLTPGLLLVSSSLGAALGYEFTSRVNDRKWAQRPSVRPQIGVAGDGRGPALGVSGHF